MNNNLVEDRFTRQRRNFIIISLFVIFYRLAELKINEINLLGNSVEIGNSSAVVFSMTVFFSYFFWRYYTTCREVGGISRFWQACTTWAEDKTGKHVVKKELVSKKPNNRVDLIKRALFTRTYYVYKNSDDPQSEAKEVTVRFYYSAMKLFSIIPTILKTSTFSEYVFPYVLGIIAILELMGYSVLSILLPQPSQAAISGETENIIQLDKDAVDTNIECIKEFFGICFISPQDINTDISIFGFGEFISALALLVIIYTISDVRYKFRVRIAPINLYLTTYILIIAIGALTLINDLWIISEWPVPIFFENLYFSQAFLGFCFLSLALIWIYFAFINPPKFNKQNAGRYTGAMMNIVLRGSDKELPTIADELGRSAKRIIDTAHPLSKDNKNPTKKELAGQYAHELLLMMGSKRLCRAIVSHAPGTAMDFFEEFSANPWRQIPIAQFVRNISTAAILDKNSILYHEDEGFNSGWFGYVRPFSNAIYGDYNLIERLSQNHGSPLDIHYETAWNLDPEQFKAYTRVALITLKSYIENNKKGLCRAHGLTESFKHIKHMASQIYKLDGKGDIYRSVELDNLDTAVDFVKDAIKILNDHATPPNVMKTQDDYAFKDIYDAIADMMFEIIRSAANVTEPADTCWTVHYNSVWSDFFSFSEDKEAEKIIHYRLRRLILKEIKDADEFVTFQTARVLGICMHVLGPVYKKRGYDRGNGALHRLVVKWYKDNFLKLYEDRPHLAEAFLIGSITFDKENKRIVKTYIQGLNREAPSEYLQL